MISKLKSFVLRHELLLVLITVAILLRIPSLFEPYWYGDEGIYLTLGQAIRSGVKLYKEIIDHKTPIIYWIAALSFSQFWFKFIFMWWNIASIVLLYRFALKLFFNKTTAVVAALLFMLSTTLPSFEGNIANGELFVIGFVLAGANVLANTTMFKRVMHQEKTQKKSAQTSQQNFFLFLGGIFFSLGILTKVPALFDAAAFGLLLFLDLFHKPDTKKLFQSLKQAMIFSAGIIVPILVSIVFFASQDSLAEYFQFGLMYNFRYSQSVAPPFSNSFLGLVFSFPGKAAIAGIVIGAMLVLRKTFSPQVRFLSIWFICALFGSLLSSRPYPHYVLQVFPPMALALATIIKKQRFSLNTAAVVFQPILFISILLLFNFGMYPTMLYYTRFVKFATGKLSQQEYSKQFNWLMDDNYAVAKYLQQTTPVNERLFIWGTNPMLYPLAKKVPTGRFTVSFHIKDFNAYEETMRSVEQHAPTVLITMKDETGEFPEFYSYLFSRYVQVEELSTMKIYRKIQ